MISKIWVIEKMCINTKNLYCSAAFFSVIMMSRTYRNAICCVYDVCTTYIIYQTQQEMLEFITGIYEKYVGYTHIIKGS